MSDPIPLSAFVGGERRPGCSGSVVCHCHGVTVGEVREAIVAGEARSVEEITVRTRAGSGCRGCRCKLQRMLLGLAPDCGRFALCGRCGWIEARCACEVA